MAQVPENVKEAIRQNPALDNSLVDEIQGALDKQVETDPCAKAREPNPAQQKEISEGSIPICAPTAVPEELKKELRDKATQETQDQVDSAVEQALPDMADPQEANRCISKVEGIGKKLKKEQEAARDEMENIEQYTTIFFCSMIKYFYFLYSRALIRRRKSNSISGLSDDIGRIIDNLNSKTYVSKLAQTYKNFVISRLNHADNRITGISKGSFSLGNLSKSNITGDVKSAMTDLTNEVSASNSGLEVSFSVGTQDVTGGDLEDFFNSSKRSATKQEKQAGDFPSKLEGEVITILTSGDSNYTNGVFTLIENKIDSDIEESAQEAARLAVGKNDESEINDEYNNNLRTTKSDIGDFEQDILLLLNTFENADPKANKKKLEDELSKVKCDGKPIVQKGQQTQVPKQNNFEKPIEDAKTFSDQGTPKLTELTYWLLYGAFVSLVGLQPQFWSQGLVPPAPSTIPLPTAWIAVAVIPTPIAITVIFINATGAFVMPAIWQLRMPPLEQNVSYFVFLAKGGNTQIKPDTGNKSQLINTTLVSGIDTDPQLSQTLPMIQDDLPTVHRLHLVNPPYLAYLQTWNSVATPLVGL